MTASKAEILHPSFWNLSSARPLRLALVLIFIIVLSGLPRQVSTAQAGWQWYKTDTHIHSSTSADTYIDLGILSNKAKAAGYNAVFVTDHNLASDFPANGVANQVPFEDAYFHWFPGVYGTQISTANELVSTPVHTGSKSLHMASASTGSAESFTWATRGPNFRSGDIILKVSIYPTRIDAGSGVYVSASIGGDSRVTAISPTPAGYTTEAGVISPGKSTLLVWQLGTGTARTASADPNARILTYSLGPYTLNTWNNYTINISNYMVDIPVADRPLDLNGLTYLKMAVASNNGTVDAYFDSYLVSASAPKTPAQEFVYRNTVIHNYDTSTFKMFPSVEMGVSKHANRFNFDITDSSQFVSYLDGVDGILATQQSGYPAQLNHPGSAGGVSTQEAIDNQAYGADFMEVPRHQEWIDIWDAILNQGVQLLGAGSTDKHTASYSSSSDSTFIYAPALDFDLFIRSLFEGRTFMASGFTGPAIFNLESTSQEPYPAQYPVYVPDTQSTANVHLVIPSGASNGYKVNWIRNGVIIATDTVTGASYDVVKSISLAGATTYVRAELRSSSGAVRALTQPIFFRDVPGLLPDKRYNVDGVIASDGRGYTRLITKGITSSNWNAANQTLSLTLENATGSLVRVLMRTNSGPQQILVNGAMISPANSLNTFEAATGSSWYYDSAATLLYLKVKHAGGVANVVANFSSVPPTLVIPTHTPTNTPTKTATSTPTSTATKTPTATQPAGGANIAVSIGGIAQGTQSVGKGQSLPASYTDVNSGPVKILSMNNVPVVGSERVIYKVNGINTSFSELMAMPNGQLDNTYWLPWYNNVDLDTQLRIANVSSSTATVHVFIGGMEMTGSPFTLQPGESTRQSFAANNGPVKIVSNVNIVAAERVIYKVNGINTSFSELMAMPNGQLDNIYWLPWYNNVDLDTQLRIANVSNSTATVNVYIGGSLMTTTPITLQPGESTRQSFAANNGPVKIVSNVNIVAAERVIYKVNNVNSSFSEMMGLPDSQLDTIYWLPWYNNVSVDTQLRIANVSSSTATVHVLIGGVEMTGSPFTLQPGESTRQSFAVNNGPVKVTSNVNIVAAERVIYKVNNLNTSFSELMGLPDSQLDTIYWLPWYNNIDLDTQLRLAVP